jgi:predicted nucleic acid-binding protein
VELADTSAWAWSRSDPDLRRDFDRLIAWDEIATCDMVKLEILYSARTGREFDELLEDVDALQCCSVGPDEWSRALQVYRELAQQGGMHQRSVKHPDLIIAAAAEAASLPVLHYDEDFERIAEVTGQAHRWIAPRGTL